jgi:NAD(P)-dependent dehydrogenase (short-subunit alcohol dehydrogenase family)
MGYVVILAVRDVSSGEEAARHIDEEAIGDSLLVTKLDVNSEDDIQGLAAFVEDNAARLHALVNNAGILPGGWAGPDSLHVPLPDVRAAFETNTVAPLRVTQVLVPFLERSGHGRVVNVSSGLGQMEGMGRDTIAYRISKAALNAVTQLLANDLIERGIKVNSVCPGLVKTDLAEFALHRTLDVAHHHPAVRPIIFRTASTGARGIAWAATLPDDGPTGGFFRDGKLLPW